MIIDGLGSGDSPWRSTLLSRQRGTLMVNLYRNLNFQMPKRDEFHFVYVESALPFL